MSSAVFSAKSLIRLKSRCQSGLWSHLKLDSGETNFQAHIVAGGIRFLVGIWAMSPFFVLAVSQRPISSFLTHGLLHGHLTTWQLASSKSEKRKKILARHTLQSSVT
jgi:hypothetical protein